MRVSQESLVGLRNRLSEQVDREAAIEIARYRTAGMDGIYAAKEREARAVLAGDQANVPYLNAEADKTGNDLADVARSVLVRATEASEKVARIDALRVYHKQLVRVARTASEARAAAKVVWPDAP